MKPQNKPQLLTRDAFREAVFARDGHRCVVCKADAKDVKRVPRDIDLSPATIAQWYFGDGTVGCKGYHAKFCTDGFPEADVLFLISALKSRYGWTPTHEERNRVLLCRSKDRTDLLKMVTKSTPACFHHKLRLRVGDLRFVIAGELEQRLRELRLRGFGLGRIATLLGVSKSGVHSACRRLGV